jgi:hypothetical protein
LQQTFARPLPATLLFDYPTADALTAFLETGTRGEGTPASVAPPTDVSAQDDLENLSQGEMLALLRQTLGSESPPR